MVIYFKRWFKYTICFAYNTSSGLTFFRYASVRSITLEMKRWNVIANLKAKQAYKNMSLQFLNGISFFLNRKMLNVHLLVWIEYDHPFVATQTHDNVHWFTCTIFKSNIAFLIFYNIKLNLTLLYTPCLLP